MSQPKGRPVLVTTAHRGVFFAYEESYDEATKKFVGTQMRNCISWSTDVKGFLGLAANGPTKGCKIGPAAPRVQLEDVTSRAECTPEAVKAWEKAPWG